MFLNSYLLITPTSKKIVTFQKSWYDTVKFRLYSTPRTQKILQFTHFSIGEKNDEDTVEESNRLEATLEPLNWKKILLTFINVIDSLAEKAEFPFFLVQILAIIPQANSESKIKTIFTVSKNN